MTTATDRRKALEQYQHHAEPLADFIARVTPKYAPIPAHLRIVTDLIEETRHRSVFATISMPPRGGKLCADSTPVLTPRGWRTHGDLEIGDELFAPDGTVTRVIDRKPDDMATVDVIFSDGAIVKVHPEHLWAVKDRSRSCQQRVVETQEMRSLGLTNKGRARFYVGHTDPIAGTARDLPFEPYFLGLWLGDGNADASKITSHADDAGPLIAELKRRGHSIGARWTHATTGAEQYMVLSDRPKGEGVYGFFHKTKYVPDVYFAALLEQRRDLLRGLVDSDGTVDPNGRVSFSNTSVQLVRDVERLVWTLGYRASTTRKEPTLSTSGIQGKQPIYTVQWTPHDGERQAWLPRKDRRIKGVRRMRAIVEIRDAEPEKGHCIAVDHPSQLYLVGIEQVPTHNTETLAHGLAWRTILDPACLNFYATFGDDLSQQTSRRVRAIVRAEGCAMDDERQSVNDWRTILQGGLRATSVGGSVTGSGCNSGLMVADDLVKGREFAESKLNRDRAWDWLRDDYMSRLEPGASMIVNMTRWNEDDVIGRLMHDPLGLEWRHIEIPAISDASGQPVDERSNPDATSYWPGVYDLDALKAIRMRGEYGWWSLYQQRPTPRGGGMFKGQWFSDALVDAMPARARWVRSWDLAASTESDSAYTAGALVGLSDGALFVADVQRGQWGADVRDRKILETAQLDGKHVEIRLPQDPGQAGKSQKPHFAKLLHGYKVSFEIETGSKDVRADPYASQCAAGNVHCLRGAPWLRAFVGEHESFPAAKLKDQVDAMSGAYGMLIGSGSDVERARKMLGMGAMLAGMQ